MEEPRYFRRDGTPCKNVVEWAISYESNDRVVQKTKLKNGLLVSTVFLGLDHSYGKGKPLIFETMVFTDDCKNDIDCDRYSTEAEAITGHNKMVKKWEAK